MNSILLIVSFIAFVLWVVVTVFLVSVVGGTYEALHDKGIIKEKAAMMVRVAHGVNYIAFGIIFTVAFFYGYQFWLLVTPEPVPCSKTEYESKAESDNESIFPHPSTYSE